MITGGCYCGAVRYEAADQPFHETLCHCADCRRAVGAHAVAWFSVTRPAFRVTHGEITRFRSSSKAMRGFCGRCGTSLTFESDVHPEEVDVTTSSLDNPGSLPPHDHTRTEGRLA